MENQTERSPPVSSQRPVMNKNYNYVSHRRCRRRRRRQGGGEKKGS